MNPNSMTENQRKDDLCQFWKKRLKEEIPIAPIASSIAIGRGAFVKK